MTGNTSCKNYFKVRRNISNQFFSCSAGRLRSRKGFAAVSATVSVSDEFQEWNISLQFLSLSYTRFCKTIYVFNQQLLVIELRRMKNIL